MRQSRLAGLLPLIAGATLMGFCGDHLAASIGLRGADAGYLVGYILVPILVLAPAFHAVEVRLRRLEARIRDLEERSARDRAGR